MQGCSHLLEIAPDSLPFFYGKEVAGSFSRHMF